MSSNHEWEPHGLDLPPPGWSKPRQSRRSGMTGAIATREEVDNDPR
jgi:hypothetical protein